MSNYQQESSRFTIRGQRWRLRVLDPVTAFEVEPEVINRFGSALVMAIVAPRQLLAGLARIEADDELAAERERVALLAQLLQHAVSSLDLDHRWLLGMFDRAVFDRATVNGTPLDDWETWARLGMQPVDKWHVLARQMQQTFAPLWLRSPYSPSKRKATGYGVKPPQTPLAVQWAAAITEQGYAASTHEVLTCWTPARLIDVVETAAYQAEVKHRTAEAAQGQGRR